MKTRIGIIGDGNVGSALRRGLERAGYDVRAVGKGQVTETGRWAEVIMLSVPYDAINDVVAELGDGISGKTVVDVTNALTEDMQLASGCTTSGAEALQQKAPGAKVVKAFNTQFAQRMDNGGVEGQPVSVFVAGDDAAAKQQVLQMAREHSQWPGITDSRPVQAVDGSPAQGKRRGC